MQASKAVPRRCWDLRRGDTGGPSPMKPSLAAMIGRETVCNQNSWHHQRPWQWGVHVSTVGWTPLVPTALWRALCWLRYSSWYRAEVSFYLFISFYFIFIFIFLRSGPGMTHFGKLDLDSSLESNTEKQRWSLECVWLQWGGRRWGSPLGSRSKFPSPTCSSHGTGTGFP